MSIRLKIFLGLTAITAILLGILFSISNSIIVKGFSKVETDNTVKSVNQAYDGIQTVITQMLVKIKDWSSWDDTYDYVVEHNQDYVDLNLNAQAADALQVDIIVITDLDGKIVGSFSFDPVTGESAPLPNDLIPFVTKGSILLQHETIDTQYKGFIMLSEGPLAFVANPILTNAGEGPEKGTLLFGRYFDKETIKSVEDTTHIIFNVYRYDDVTVSGDIKQIEAKTPDKNSIFIKTISTVEISGYVTINDVYDKPALLVETVETRPIYEQSQVTVWYFEIFTLISGLVLILSGVFFINFYLANRIRRMAQQLKTVDPVSDTSASIREHGSDEVSILAQSINGMFDKIRNSSKKIRDLVEQLKMEKVGVEKTVMERTAELLDEKAKFVASVDGIVGAYLLLDKDGKVILTNGVVPQILGENKDKWTIETIQERLLPVMDVLKEFKNCVETKEKLHLKSVLLGKKYLDIHLTPIFVNDSGEDKNVGALLLITDITEEKVMQRSKDEFFSIASHELRTPLSVIRGNMSIVLKYYLKDIKNPELNNIIDDTYQSSIRLIGIVNDFLDVSKLEQGKIEFKKERLDIVKTTSNVIYELAEKAKEKNIRLGISDNSLKTCEIIADEEKVKEVLINLIANAITFTDNGGVAISITKDDNNAKIEVSDTGRGIPPALQSLLFRKFQQAGESISTRDPYKGTGLGLYISKMLMEGMGGKIELEKSEPGKGSTFLIVFPMS